MQLQSMLYLICGLFSHWSLCQVEISSGNSVEKTQIGASDDTSESPLELWIKKDLVSLERVLESNPNVHEIVDTDPKFLTQFCHDDTMTFMDLVISNWSHSPESFEIVLRHATKDLPKSRDNEGPAHQLARSSIELSYFTERLVPAVYFTDLYSLALCGYKVNELNDDSKSPFEIVFERITTFKTEKRLVNDWLVDTLNLFSYSSTIQDPFSRIDIERVFSWQELNEQSSTLANARLGAIKNNNKRSELVLPEANSFNLTRNPCSNSWFLEDIWLTDDQKKYAETFAFGRIAGVLNPQVASNGVRSRSNNGETSLKNGISFAMQAYASRHLDELKQLLESGASPDIPLEVELWEFVEDIVKPIASPSYCPRKGDTILLAASLDPLRKAETIPLILKHTKKPDQRDLLNRNSIHRFLYHRVPVEQSNLLDLLIEAGVDVNAKSVSGNTPCHVAANRNASLIPAMAKAGADLHAKNVHGETPLDLLRRSVEEKWIFHEQNAKVLMELEAMGAIRDKTSR